MTTVRISYRKNPLNTDQISSEQPHLYATIHLGGYDAANKVENVPIYYRKLEKPVGAVRVVYTTSIAGLTLEAGNLHRLKDVIQETLQSLIRFERLPEYVFQVGENAYPIYHPPGQLLTRYPGGPVFSTTDIASLRVWLADHFKSLGHIQHRWEMGLLYLSPYDLQLYRPQCVIRIPGEDNPDIPVFPDPKQDTMHLIAPVNSISLSEPFEAGKGILTIHNAVEKYLIEHKKLLATNQTTIRKLPLKDWEGLQKQLPTHPYQITYHRDRGEITQPIYKPNGAFLTGRVNRLGRVVLFTAPSLEGLKESVGKDLSSYGAIKNPDAVRLLPLREA